MLASDPCNCTTHYTGRSIQTEVDIFLQCGGAVSDHFIGLLFFTDGHKASHHDADDLYPNTQT